MNKSLKKAPLIVFLVLFIFACAEKRHPFVDIIEKVHNKRTFKSRDAVAFDIVLKFGEKERLNGKITSLTNTSKAKIELSNGEKIVTHGSKVYYSKNLIDSAKIRFDAYTWNYFFALPYKLSDQGTVWQDYSNPALDQKDYEVAKLTFESGTGDAPDDWYILNADKKTGLLNTAAYIVTAGKTQEEAEKDPHAIEYLEYKKVYGVPFAHTWKFWSWSKEAGLGKQLGEGKLENIAFLNENEVDFSVDGLTEL